MGAGNRQTDIEQMLSDPNKFGLPTFEQYAKNPDQYKVSRDIFFQKIDQGQSLIPGVNRHKYKIKLTSGTVYDCDTLARVEAIANQEGFNVWDLIVKPEVREGATTDMFIEVTFECPRRDNEIKASAP